MPCRWLGGISKRNMSIWRNKVGSSFSLLSSISRHISMTMARHDYDSTLYMIPRRRWWKQMSRYRPSFPEWERSGAGCRFLHLIWDPLFHAIKLIATSKFSFKGEFASSSVRNNEENAVCHSGRSWPYIVAAICSMSSTKYFSLTVLHQWYCSWEGRRVFLLPLQTSQLGECARYGNPTRVVLGVVDGGRLSWQWVTLAYSWMAQIC